VRQAPYTSKEIITANNKCAHSTICLQSITHYKEATLSKLPEPWSPEYITVGLAAKHCGVSNTTVLRWITTGHLPAFRLPGGHYRIEREDFSRFLTRYSLPAQPAYPEINRK
jgi:excisionase family DNA binding protein